MKFSFQNLIIFLLSIVFMTSSMDIFMNLNVFGFTVRFVFVPILLIIALSLFWAHKKANRLSPNFLGYAPALVWLVFLIVFIPNTTIIVRNIAYVLWLIIYLIFIVSAALLYSEPKYFYKIMKWYLRSFLLVSVFGIIQFILAIGGIEVLLQQKWLNGLPRASAFSYEPSYLSTYLLIGWTICFYLVVSKSNYLKYLQVKSVIVVSTIAILLSGSRMGILFIIVLPLSYALYNFRTFFTRFVLNKLALRYLVTILFLVSSALIYFAYNFNQALVFLNGIGLYGTVSHSYTYRTNDQADTFTAFKKSPIIGYSLGGLPTQIALIRGKIITTQKQAKDFEGMNIFAEVLAASGIIGFLFFLFFLYSIFKKSISLYKKLRFVDTEYSKLGQALLFGLLCELVMLIMNQNILRAYLWVHIALVNIAFFTGVKILKNKKLEIIEHTKISDSNTYNS